MSNTYQPKIAIIGAGIAGRSVAYYLRKKKPFLDIDIFDGKNYFPPTSLSSTGIVTSHGVQKGITPLGDLLWDSFEFFCKFYHEAKPRGVYLGKHFHLIHPREKEKCRRYAHLTPSSFGHKNSYTQYQEDCFCIEPSEFLNWLYPDQHIVSELVFDLKQEEKKVILTFSQGRQAYDWVWDCRNWTNHRQRELKPVQGAYIEFDWLNPWSEFQSFGVEGFNLILKGPQKKGLFGSVNENADYFLFDQNLLYQKFEEVSSLLGFSLEMGGHRFKVGIRTKGKKRMPQLLQQGRVVSLNALYKNGWSFGPYLALASVNNFLEKGGRLQ